MKKEIKNVPASIKERLKNISVESGKDFNKILRQYVQERFLYRLSKTIYSGNFILKGALLFFSFFISRTRPTRDIDFLGSEISNDAKDIKNTMKIITDVDDEDGLVFDNKSIEVVDIVKDGDYHGVRVKINAKLGTIRERIQIDIGFGDIITDGPIELDYPTLLDLSVPRLKVYSLETAIAEKFEAIVSLQLQTSRMKDFYDIYFIASNNRFELATLSKAIKTTFDNRSTDTRDSDSIFTDNFKKDEPKNELWHAFIKRNELDSSLLFGEVVDYIQKFIQPACKDVSQNKSWDPLKATWD